MVCISQTRIAAWPAFKKWANKKRGLVQFALNAKSTNPRSPPPSVFCVIIGQKSGEVNPIFETFEHN